MTDPLYPVGARVIYQGQPVMIEAHGFGCFGDSVYRFLGYQIRKLGGSFSGWHPEAELVEDKS